MALYYQLYTGVLNEVRSANFICRYNPFFMRPRTLLSIFLLLPSLARAQKTEAPLYPQAYFRNPLDIPIFLAGNFGECRPGHFHSGVDIKTLGKEGQPVHAAADGYISRIKMEKGGFGHGIYITHPNGYTTLYAHLNDFIPALQKYVKKEQYEQKRWDVDILFRPDQFPVKKGQQIAWSGNTGASTAPHLHFEIRNTKTEHPLNPELFGLPVIDHLPPVPAEVAIYNMSTSIYEQTPVLVTLKKQSGGYAVAGDTVNTDAGMAGIGVNIYDFMEGSDNTIAYLNAKLYMDDSLQSELNLDNIGYDETRYINAFADYKTKELQHKWIQCFFKLPGNHLDSIYRFLNSNNGSLNVTDKAIHKVRIVFTDDRSNSTVVSFYLKPRDHVAPPLGVQGMKFNANQSNTFSDPNVSFTLDNKQLYDNINFIFARIPYAKACSDKYQLHYAYVPVHHYFDLQVKPNKTIPFNLRSKVVIMYSDDKDEDGRAAAFEDNGWYKARVRNFGTYWLDIDSTAPVIKSLQKNGANLSKAKQIAFEVKDLVTSVRTFGGYLDGKWICFEQHGSSFFYKFDEHCSKGKHKLVFKAEDENGNAATYNLSFTR